MSDEVLTIKLTEREIDLLHQCLSTNMETVKRRHDVTGSTADLLQELGELSDDLLEQLHRRDDGWGIDAEINAETQMFTVGVEAREKIKATSRAAGRRALKFVAPGTPKSRSDTQDVDVWAPPPNDPAKW